MCRQQCLVRPLCRSVFVNKQVQEQSTARKGQDFFDDSASDDEEEMDLDEEDEVFARCSDDEDGDVDSLAGDGGGED